VAALAVLFVQACKVGPDYVEPELPVTDEWRAAVEAEMSQEEPDIRSGGRASTTRR
jgi:hypothetical protein